jgi:hypothetical protein
VYLEERLRAAPSLPALRFSIANETFGLFGYRQAFMRDLAAGTPRLVTVSGLAQPTGTSPFGQWLDPLGRVLAAREAPDGDSLGPEGLPAALGAAQKSFDNAASRSELAVLNGRVAERQAEVASIGQQLGRIVVTAPRAGVVVFGDTLDWQGKPVVTGERIVPLAARVVAIDGNRTRALPHPMFAAEHGGRVPILRQPDGRLVPRDGLYRVRLRLDALPPAAARGAVATGTAVIEAEPRSLLRDWANGIAAVVVRESGF